MKVVQLITSFLFVLPVLSATAQTSAKLTGTIIGTGASIDYSTGKSSTTVNTKEMAFDGNFDTYFASYARSLTWLGLDLGTPHVITKVAWAPRNDSNGPKRVQLAVFEGSNDPNFMDAVPLYLTKEQGKVGKLSEADVNVSKGFRYVRYVGPNDARCNISELEFWGYEGEGTDEVFYRPTNLPLVNIHVENAQEPYDKVTELNCVVSILTDKGLTRINNDGEEKEIPQLLTDAATVRLRGNASAGFEKKPYRFKFESKHHVLDSPAKAKKWTLINNYGDKTLMRNILAFELSERLGMAYTPFCRPVDVMMNGEYKGCYQLCDQIEVGKNRVPVEECEVLEDGTVIDGGYLIEVDAYAYQEASMFYSNHGNPVTIKYPKEDEITWDQYEYIEGLFNGMESCLFDSKNFTSEGALGYRSRLDLESFLRHFLVGEISGNTDTYWSMNLYKFKDDNHFYVGPSWDFDLAFENDNRTYPINNKSDYIYRTKGSYAGDMRKFVDRIVVYDTKALARLKEIYADARQCANLGPEYLNKRVDELAAELWESQELNFTRWPMLNKWVHQNPQVAGSYQGEVNVVKNYITGRFTWMDKKLNFDATGLDVVETQNNFAHDNRIFNLAGQEVSAPLQPGVYLKNGRKFIVK